MSDTFTELVSLIAKLRGPNGCPWDRKQTHDSLKPFLVEETYEVLEALDHHPPPQLCEELGDLLLQILLHAEIEAEQHHFTITDVLLVLKEKLIRRHPHVFNQTSENSPTLNAEKVGHQWEHIKQRERTEAGKPESVLEGVPLSLPALLRAYQLQKRAARVGFDWTKPEEVLEKLDEELEELRTATVSHQAEFTSPSKELRQKEAIEHEFGDVLFTIANLSRFLEVNPEEALRKACNRFVSRFTSMEDQAASLGKTLAELTPAEWEELWNTAKQQECQISFPSKPNP